MDYDDSENDESATTSCLCSNNSVVRTTNQDNYDDISDCLGPDALENQNNHKKQEAEGLGTYNSTHTKACKSDKTNMPTTEDAEEYCNVKLDAITKLKDSTKKLLCLLEELQSKTHSKIVIPDDPPKLASILKPSLPTTDNPYYSMTNVIGACAIRNLESHTKALDTIVIEDEDDDCSVYKRLTRKCHCLNQREYNDLIILFNEDDKFCTSAIGEIIKNLRIVKKFLYMGGPYTKNALLFLNEGLNNANHSEKIEIIQGCAFADVCNVFEMHTIVTACISWPCKYENFGDNITQGLAAGLLFKLVDIEEGRRYLNFNSKITCDIKKVIRKKSSKLEYDTLEMLVTILNACHPPPGHINVTHYCRPVDEDLGNKTVNALMQYRQFMSYNEIFQHLDMLNSLSSCDKGRIELTPCLPNILSVFRRMLLEYDDSEINIIITNIMNNLVAKNLAKEPISDEPKVMTVANMATEPIKMKNEVVQIPTKKNTKKNMSKSMTLGSAPNKNRIHSKRKVNHWEALTVNFKEEQLRTLNRSRKFTKGNIPTL